VTGLAPTALGLNLVAASHRLPASRLPAPVRPVLSLPRYPILLTPAVEEKVLRTTPSQSHTEAGTPRRRAQRACGECHLHKTKCSGDLPRCKRCRSNDLPCVYTAARRNFSITPASEHSNPDDGQALLSVAMGVPSSAASIDSTDGSFTSYPPHEPMDGLAAEYDAPLVPLASRMLTAPSHSILFKKDLLLRHLDVYFEYFHPLSCYGFLHPATTYREVDLHRFSPYLATAVCAVTATILDPEAGPSFAAQCNEEVEIYLWRNMKRLDIEVLRLVCLCIMYNWSQGQAAKCWMYQAFAVRLVKGLRLNWEANRPCAEQEATRRLVWLVFVSKSPHCLRVGDIWVSHSFDVVHSSIILPPSLFYPLLTRSHSGIEHGQAARRRT